MKLFSVKNLVAIIPGGEWRRGIEIEWHTCTEVL
jgi:hypothetical protein